MNVRPHGLTAIYFVALLAACNSSEKTGTDAPPAGKDGPNALADTADAVRPDSPPDIPVTPDRVDGPTGSVDAPPVGVDAPPVGVDAPIVDGPTVDAPSLDGKSDVASIRLPDGRMLLMVDYCGPIQPLSAASTGCPATFEEAMAQAATRQDASIPYYSARIWACSEGHYTYVPYGYGTVCYYEPTTRKLVAITAGDDTPSPCAEADTASFVRSVYGQWLRCTGGSAVAIVPVVDAGAVDSGSIDSRAGQ